MPPPNVVDRPTGPRVRRVGQGGTIVTEADGPRGDAVVGRGGADLQRTHREQVRCAQFPPVEPGGAAVVRPLPQSRRGVHREGRTFRSTEALSARAVPGPGGEGLHIGPVIRMGMGQYDRIDAGGVEVALELGECARTGIEQDRRPTGCDEVAAPGTARPGPAPVASEHRERACGQSVRSRRSRGSPRGQGLP